MNTKQLIILWYGWFILTTFVLTYYSINTFTFNTTVAFSILIAIILAYLTYRDSTNINTKKVFIKGILPILSIITLTALSIFIYELIYERNKNIITNINIDKVEIFEPNFQINTVIQNHKYASFSGRIRNNSHKIIRSITLRIRIYEYTTESLNLKRNGEFTVEGKTYYRLTPPWGSNSTYLKNLDEKTIESLGKQIDSTDLYTTLNIPASETKSFKIEQYTTQLEPSIWWVWDYEIINVR